MSSLPQTPIVRGIPIRTVVFVDDSRDESFIADYSFKKAKIHASLVHYPSFSTFETILADAHEEEVRATIAVIDLNLSVSKGTDGILSLRSQSRYREMIVGICSGSDDPADRQAAMNAGADFFVAKPLNLSALQTICLAVPGLTIALDPDPAGPVSIIRST